MKEDNSQDSSINEAINFFKILPNIFQIKKLKNQRRAAPPSTGCYAPLPATEEFQTPTSSNISELHMKQAIDVAVAEIQKLVLTANGLVFCFECNDEGALGKITAEYELEYLPGLVNIPGKVIKLSSAALEF